MIISNCVWLNRRPYKKKKYFVNYGVTAKYAKAIKYDYPMTVNYNTFFATRQLSMYVMKYKNAIMYL